MLLLNVNELPYFPFPVFYKISCCWFYQLLVTLSFHREINKQEFKKVMSLMRAQNRQGAHHRDGRRTGLKVRGSVEDGGLVEYFFGKDGKTCLRHDRFVKFMRDLHDEVTQHFHVSQHICGHSESET